MAEEGERLGGFMIRRGRAKSGGPLGLKRAARSVEGVGGAEPELPSSK